MSARKYLSGFQKQNLTKKQCDGISKYKKLSNYLTMSSNSSTSLSPHTVETSHENSNETIDTVQIISISSNIPPTVDNCDTSTSTNADNHLCGSKIEPWNKMRQSRRKKEESINIKYSDITNWPITCNNDLIQKSLMQDIHFFQNKRPDDVWIESSRAWEEQKRCFFNKYYKTETEKWSDRHEIMVSLLEEQRLHILFQM